jgi:hypothetical protein
VQHSTPPNATHIDEALSMEVRFDKSKTRRQAGLFWIIDLMITVFVPRVRFELTTKGL